LKAVLVAGARPNFMKIAPIFHEMKKQREYFDIVVLHTGQHYDYNMSGLFFKDLSLPKPDIFLGVGPGTQAVQTAKIVVKFEKVCVKEKPDLIIVVGDVNSTLACSLVAAKLCIPIAHVEAGLRSFDRAMPEEINRVIVDHISDFLFTTCEDANDNLKREGISRKNIFFVGNVMIDTLKNLKVKSKKSSILNKIGLQKNNYAVLTLHRPSNVDDREKLQRIFSAFQSLSRHIPIIFPVHPRTLKQIKNFGISFNNKNIKLIEPLGYLDFMKLYMDSKLVLTDSGGIQEETTYSGIPCLTLRENTERPITVKEGTNILVGSDKNKIIKESLRILNEKCKAKRAPRLWDGKSAERIVKILRKKL
jgi:UDP-N-acetylglucosamine 2-epimerase (non-hydrolysing)